MKNEDDGDDGVCTKQPDYVINETDGFNEVKNT